MRNVLLIIFLFSITLALAQVKKDPDVEKDKKATEASESKKDKFVAKFKRINDKVYKIMQVAPAPIITYSTETSLLLGLAKFNAFDLNKQDTISEASSVVSAFGASFRGQIYLDAGAKFYWNENKNISEISLGLEKFPRQFWGVGNEINPETSALVTKSFFQAVLKYKRMIFHNFYLGANYNYYNVFNVSYDIRDIHNPEPYKGNDGGVNSGLGGIIAYDSRDNAYNATEGVFVEFQTEFYTPILGSEFTFNRYKLDIRNFYTLGHFVLGYQLYSEANYGHPPVYSLAMMGGSERMRGYYEGQYRDNTLADAQIELRHHLFWLIGAVVYGSVGQVAPSYSEFVAENFKYTAGCGLRLMVDPVHKTNLRLDFGIGEKTYAVFFGFSEAF